MQYARRASVEALRPRKSKCALILSTNAKFVIRQANSTIGLVMLPYVYIKDIETSLLCSYRCNSVFMLLIESCCSIPDC